MAQTCFSEKFREWLDKTNKIHNYNTEKVAKLYHTEQLKEKEVLTFVRLTIFKTLEFTDRKEQIAFGRYVAFISESELGGCQIPQLMQVGTTIRKLKNIYPKQDFEGVRIITLKVSEIETKNT